MLGKLQVPGKPWEGGRGTWHQPAQPYPAAALGKALFKLFAGFLSFPSKDTTTLQISGLPGF